MKIFKFFLLMLLCSTQLLAQQLDNRIAPTLLPLSDVALVTLPPLDNNILLQNELERRGSGIAPRFAEVIAVDISPATAGTWETLANGNAVWRLRIQSSGAKSLNLGFSTFFMPENGSLILYTANKQKVMGPFTPADNEVHEQLWTPVLDGDDLIIEVQLPADKRNDLQLNLTSINHDFVGFNSVVSGSCNLDVICGEEDGWAIIEQYRDIIQSVGVISTGGTTFCTGFLVNSTRNDCTPYFMTANHCSITPGNASSLVVYWNYVNSFCRQPDSAESGFGGDGDFSVFNTGAIHKAGYAVSDFTLVELDDEVPPEANAFFAGWTADPDFSDVDTLIGIHHPTTDEKRISFDFDTPEVTFYFDDVENSNADHVRVPDWDVGTTEGGSSGSPLFDDKKRVLGQLHGGGAACGNDQSDWYGAFATSWEGGGTPETRLKDWLDPDNTGVMAIDGRGQLLCSFFVLAEDTEMTVCASTPAVYTIQVSENFIAPVTLSVSDLPVGANISFGENPIMPGASTTFTVGNTANIAAGTYTISISGTDGTETASSTIGLTVFEAAPAGSSLLTPENGTEDLVLTPMFSWSPMANGTIYHFELSLDVDFSTILFEATGLTAANTTSPILVAETHYYWRVTPSNICGMGATSGVFTFLTAAIACEIIEGQGFPITISDGAPPNLITSSIEINLPGLVTEVSITDFNITHSWVGDLTATLTSPLGTEITLFDTPDNGDCEGDNVEINLSDDAENTAAMLNGPCGDNPAIAGNFQPLDPFSAFNGEAATGTWTLSIADGFNQDGGALTNWNLGLCVAIADEAALFTNTNAFNFCESTAINFDILAGAGFEGEINLSASGLPAGAVVHFGVNPIMPGASTNVTVGGVSSGSYDLIITADDGTTSTDLTISINVEGAPGIASLNSPVNGADFIVPDITFGWDGTENTENYLIEVSSTESFNDIIESATITGLMHSVTFNDPGIYYWRVTAINECGAAITDFSTFTIIPLTVNELKGKKVDISPNPTSGKLSIGLSAPAKDAVSIQVYDINGQLLQTHYIKTGENQAILSLEAYTPGVYLLKLTDGNAHLTKRIILQ